MNFSFARASHCKSSNSVDSGIEKLSTASLKSSLHMQINVFLPHIRLDYLCGVTLDLMNTRAYRQALEGTWSVCK